MIPLKTPPNLLTALTVLVFFETTFLASSAKKILLIMMIPKSLRLFWGGLHLNLLKNKSIDSSYYHFFTQLFWVKYILIYNKFISDIFSDQHVWTFDLYKCMLLLHKSLVFKTIFYKFWAGLSLTKANYW